MKTVIIHAEHSPKHGWSGYIDYEGKIECAEYRFLQELKDHFSNYLYARYKIFARLQISWIPSNETLQFWNSL